MDMARARPLVHDAFGIGLVPECEPSLLPGTWSSCLPGPFGGPFPLLAASCLTLTLHTYLSYTLCSLSSFSPCLQFSNPPLRFPLCPPSGGPALLACHRIIALFQALLFAPFSCALAISQPRPATCFILAAPPLYGKFLQTPLSISAINHPAVGPRLVWIAVVSLLYSALTYQVARCATRVVLRSFYLLK